MEWQSAPAVTWLGGRDTLEADHAKWWTRPVLGLFPLPSLQLFFPFLFFCFPLLVPGLLLGRVMWIRLFLVTGSASGGEDGLCWSG